MPTFSSDANGHITITSCHLHSKPRDWGTFKGEILKGPTEGNFWYWFGEHNGKSWRLHTQGFADWSMLELECNGAAVKCFWTVEEAEEFIKNGSRSV